MYDKQSTVEQTWINNMLCVPFKGNDILKEQITNAEVEREVGANYLCLQFHVNRQSAKYPYGVRVPIEMRVYQENQAPIQCMLHIIDGFADELEVFTADSSHLHTDEMKMDHVEFVIDEEVRHMEEPHMIACARCEVSDDVKIQ